MEKAVLLKSTPTWAPVRANSVANQIVLQVRGALFEGRFQPGDLLGSEKDLAAQFDVSRITVRDALRTLETMGIIEIRVGAGGGARIAKGNLDHYSDALSIQFRLSGITEQEVMDLQIAIEGAAVELAASKRNQRDLYRLSSLLDEANGFLADPIAFTEAGQKFHLAIVEASGNRALIAQFKAFRYVVWPKNGKRAKPEIAAHALKIHKDIYHAISESDPESARKIMVAHLESIRAMIFSKNSEKAINSPICC
jgi:GntR family transcriptional regulator, transcriptional repressor for pyruvate dehydrogenase complex